MADLTTTTKTTASSCCALEAQATCCEQSAKAKCCGDDDTCGCHAARGPMRASPRPSCGQPYRTDTHSPGRLAKDASFSKAKQ